METKNFRYPVAMLSLTLMFLVLPGCGSGGNGSPDSDPTQINMTKPLPTGTYKLTFSAMSTATLPASISGISLAVKLPVGLAVSTINGSQTGPIASSSITTGSALQATALAFGVYSASTRTAYVAMATSQPDFRKGQYMNLFFTVTSTASASPNDILIMNAIFNQYKVVGLDTTTNSSVDLSGIVKTTFDVNR